MELLGEINLAKKEKGIERYIIKSNVGKTDIGKDML